MIMKTDVGIDLATATNSGWQKPCIEYYNVTIIKANIGSATLAIASYVFIPRPFLLSS